MLPPFDPWISCAAADVAAAHAGTDALAARQARRLTELLAAAARWPPGSRLYRRLLMGRIPAGLRLEDLPIMRKADLMRQ